MLNKGWIFGNLLFWSFLRIYYSLNFSLIEKCLFYQ